jgi:hypothetical protein
MFTPLSYMRVATPLPLCIFFLSLLIFLPSSKVQAREVRIPITLDHYLLTSLLKQQYFSGPGNSAQLIDTSNGCNEIKLSLPQVTEHNKQLHFTASTFVRLGLPLGDNCILPLQWQGTTDLLLEPAINRSSWQLQFKPKEVKLYENGDKPAAVVNRILEQLIPEVKRFMEDFKVNLAPPVKDLQTALLPLFADNVQEQTKRMLESLSPHTIMVHNQGVTVDILGEIEENKEPALTPPQLTLTEDEHVRLVETWETLDVFFIHLITSLTSSELNQEERDLLIHLVLDTRYNFLQNLQEQTISHDFVRHQFISTWSVLSPLFKKFYLQNTNDKMLAYLSFITASDALATLDKIGPTMGIEISRNGLIRLLKLIDVNSDQLEYSDEFNPILRKLFYDTPHPPPQEPPQGWDGQESSNQNSFFQHIYNYFMPTAFASSPTFREIKQWQAPKTDKERFLQKVIKLLNTTSTTHLKRSKLPSELHPFFPKLILAIAWQESCYRQFIVKNKKLTYLLSYNNTSVGIMQINERVWRGIYQMNRLRWDIHYNAFAGCEIVDLYLKKYILPKTGPKVRKNKKLLASVVYSLYNGGPTQLKKYFKRHKNNKLYQSDKFFDQKYHWVIQEKWSNIHHCL